jgi:hypothetical protein
MSTRYIGQRCRCQRGIIGCVTGYDPVRQVWLGYQVNHPERRWQSKYPARVDETHVIYGFTLGSAAAVAVGEGVQVAIDLPQMCVTLTVAHTQAGSAPVTQSYTISFQEARVLMRALNDYVGDDPADSEV